MKLAFPDLPYAYDALEPHCSAKTLEFHHDKHHRAYFDQTVELIKGTKYEAMGLEEIVRTAAGDEKNRMLFNNAAQLWNHDLFWLSMGPKGGGDPRGALMKAIERDFGSCDAMCGLLQDKAVTQFGSGWAWLVYCDGKLSVTATHDADNPLTEGAAALLALDVWEHAYYLDYQNRRPAFVEAFLKNLVNWDHAAALFESVAGTERTREKRQAGRRR